MTVLTLRYQRGHFTVSGPDFEMRRFETRREARDWCAQNYPGSPIEDTEPTRPSEWLKGAEAICLNDRHPLQQISWQTARNAAEG
jgi:hypothetical protein